MCFTYYSIIRVTHWLYFGWVMLDGTTLYNPFTDLINNIKHLYHNSCSVHSKSRPDHSYSYYINSLIWIYSSLFPKLIKLIRLLGPGLFVVVWYNFRWSLRCHILSYTHTLEGRDCRHTVSYPHPCECVYVVWLSTMQSTRTLLHTNQFETGWLLVAALNIRTYSIPVNVCVRKSWGEMCVDHLNSMCDCRIQNAEGAKFPVSRRLLFIYNCGIGQMTNIRV